MNSCEHKEKQTTSGMQRITFCVSENLSDFSSYLHTLPISSGHTELQQNTAKMSQACTEMQSLCKGGFKLQM